MPLLLLLPALLGVAGVEGWDTFGIWSCIWFGF